MSVESGILTYNKCIILERHGKSNTKSQGEKMTKTEKILLFLTAAFFIAALFLLPRGGAARQAEETFVLPGPSPAGAEGSLTVTLERTIDINTADAEELTALPGVGPTTAAAIVAWREEHGPFSSLEELLLVPGFGPGTLDAVRAAAGGAP